MPGLPLFRGVNDALTRLVEALSDPARQRRAAFTVVLGYAVLWTIYGLIAKSSQDLHADTTEMVVWMREPALGYPKHPPFPVWVMWCWFRLFPLADWSVILLQVVNASLAIYLAFELAGEWLEREKRAAVPFLLAAIPFYNFLVLKYDANAALVPLWPLAIWAFMRSLDTRHAGWAALAGLAAAAAMLTKYWSVFLLVALLLVALTDRRRAAYFRSLAPWVTALVFIVAVTPHVVWLVVNHFPPITWVTTRRLAVSFWDGPRSLIEFWLGTFGYASIALLLVLIFLRPSLAAIADSWFPRDQRRSAALLFWVPLALPMVPALALNISLLSIWNMPALSLLPVLALASPLVAVTPVAATRIAATMTIVTLIVVAASPVVAYMALKRGVENDAAYARLAMEEADRAWRKTEEAKPLRLIAGPFVLVSAASFYGADQPSTFADFSHYLSPWVDDARIAREGMVIMTATSSPWFDFTEKHLAAFPDARRTEVTLTRHWLGFESAPRRFVIAVVPPRP